MKTHLLSFKDKSDFIVNYNNILLPGIAYIKDTKSFIYIHNQFDGITDCIICKIYVNDDNFPVCIGGGHYIDNKQTLYNCCYNIIIDGNIINNEDLLYDDKLGYMYQFKENGEHTIIYYMKSLYTSEFNNDITIENGGFLTNIGLSNNNNNIIINKTDIIITPNILYVYPYDFSSLAIKHIYINTKLKIQDPTSFNYIKEKCILYV